MRKTCCDSVSSRIQEQQTIDGFLRLSAAQRINLYSKMSPERPSTWGWSEWWRFELWAFTGPLTVYFEKSTAFLNIFNSQLLIYEQKISVTQ